MSELSNFYDLLEILKREGHIDNKDYNEKVKTLDYAILKYEILPLIKSGLKRGLERINHDIEFTVRYDNNTGISITLPNGFKVSDNVNDPSANTVLISGNKTPMEVHNAKNENDDAKKTEKKRHRKQTLVITYPEGKVLKKKNNADTFVEFVKKVGIENVVSLNLEVLGVPLLSQSIDENKATQQKEISDGWYLMTHVATTQKRALVRKIAKKLDLDLTAEIE